MKIYDNLNFSENKLNCFYFGSNWWYHKNDQLTLPVNFNWIFIVLYWFKIITSVLLIIYNKISIQLLYK